MPTFRIVVMLKPGVLDAPGQAVARGLAALDFPTARVRMGKVIELEVAEDQAHRLDEMCARFLANPLIETWEIQRRPEAMPAAGGAPGGAPGEAAPADTVPPARAPTARPSGDRAAARPGPGRPPVEPAADAARSVEAGP